MTKSITTAVGYYGAHNDDAAVLHGFGTGTASCSRANLVDRCYYYY